MRYFANPEDFIYLFFSGIVADFIDTEGFGGDEGIEHMRHKEELSYGEGDDLLYAWGYIHSAVDIGSYSADIGKGGEGEVVVQGIIGFPFGVKFFEVAVQWIETVVGECFIEDKLIGGKGLGFDGNIGEAFIAGHVI